ncbi:MAG TPA: response regulator [Chitinophagaceae bacterium]|nr:response regulator [Chitinophagaceae bacterium]
MEKKILVVDDHLDILNVVDRFLKANGFNVLAHSSGKDVIEVVKVFKPDLILLDLQLDGKFSTHICKTLKKTTHIPVVLFSAYLDLEKMFHECDADAYISKPFDLEYLLNIISEQLSIMA